MLRPQLLRGMRDFAPEQLFVRHRVIAAFREVFEQHGFEPIETPALEHYDTLKGSYGEDEKLVYHFEDHGGREIGLRYDLTVPLARFVAQHQNDLTFPFKRYHIAPVWRADRPQRGRYREFWQCDADIVGTASMMADADVVSIVIDALNAINMPDFVVHINHRKLLEAIAMYAGVDQERAGSIYRAIDKLNKIGVDGVVDDLAEAGVERGVGSRVVELVSATGTPDAVLDSVADQLSGIDLAEEAVDDLRQLFNYLAALGVPTKRYELDLALARGMTYYTGPVYEATVREHNIGSVAGAGRYDGLVGRFSNQDFPATGISLGLERIIDVVEDLNLLDVSPTVSELLVTTFDLDHVSESLGLTAMLRNAGFRVETYLEPKRNLGRQFRYADQRGIPYALVVGPDEVERHAVTIKDLKSGDQFEVNRDEIVDRLRAALGRD